MQHKLYHVTVTIPHLASKGTVDFISFLSVYGKPVSVVQIFSNPSKKGVPVSVELNFQFDEEYKAAALVSKLQMVFNPKFITIRVSESDRFKDEHEELEYMIKTHDTYYEMSDDHRVWLAGEQSKKRIMDLAKKLNITVKL
jgi:hypothetical protein